MADLSITAADVLSSQPGSAQTGQAGVNVTQGQVVYNNTASSPNLLYLASASSSASAIVAGIAVNAGDTGQPLQYIPFDPALILGAAGSAGEVIYLSQNAGNITATAGDVTGSSYLVVLGQCITSGTASTAVWNFRPLTTNAATLAQL